MPNPDSPNNALPAGTQVGQFVIRQALGAGGFGITYIAYDVHLNREVVIKENFPSFYASREHDTLTVCPSSTSNTELFEKSLISFTNEAKMIASLKHPNIVSIFSIFDAYGTVFFAMPYHQGGSLSQFVKAFHQPNYTPLTEEQLRVYLIPILEALQYMHDHNVYHRDIKPDNILIDEKTGDPILIDFGAARELLDNKTQAATVVATFGFAAPEQIMALKIGPYTDLYALAATMYALMTGKIPERGDARLLFEDKHKKLSDDLLMQTRYSRPFLLSIDQALEPDWKKRPQTAQEWLDALQRKSSFWTAKRILSLAAILILVIISAIFILPSSNQNQEEIAKTPVASNQQQPITKAPATTEPPPATNPAPTKDNKTASTAKPAEPNTNTTKNNPDSFNNLEDWVDFVETTTKVSTDEALQTKDADNTPVATQTIEDFKTPVSKAIYQANINPNAQVKANAKYFIFCWGRHLFWDQKKFQLQAATIDAAKKDPNIQFISISCRFPLTETNHNNFNDIPTILDLYTYTDQGGNDYLEVIKTDDTVKIPWNTTIEDTYKQRWKGHLRTGKVKGEFPLPDENKKIDIPGFLPTGCEPSFFILDAQGRRIFPQSMKGYGQLEDIWDAYKDISTLSEDELTLAYDKYVKTSQETQTSTNDNQVDQTLEDLKTPVSQALYQANINPDAHVTNGN